jgi:hypothetical protein
VLRLFEALNISLEANASAVNEDDRTLIAQPFLLCSLAAFTLPRSRPFVEKSEIDAGRLREAVLHVLRGAQVRSSNPSDAEAVT